MDLKKILKTLKLQENRISMVIGIIILIVAAIIVINYVKNLKNQNQTPNSNQQQNQIQTHKVVKGESLWSIAKLYYKTGSDWKKIAEANNITNPSKLEVGQELIIPDTEIAVAVPETQTVRPSPTPQITDSAASTTSEITSDSYVVVKGDNLWKIAERAYGDGSKWIEIAKTNNLKNPRIIHSGNVFTLPRK